MDFMELYVDANVFVATQQKGHIHYKDSNRFFSICKKKKYAIKTSVFTLLEIGCTISKKLGEKDAIRYIIGLEHKSRENNIFFYEPKPKTKSLFNLVLEILLSSIKYRVHTGDTIHIHTIETNKLKINALITWNTADYKKYCNIKKIKLYTPKQFLLSCT